MRPETTLRITFRRNTDEERNGRGKNYVWGVCIHQMCVGLPIYQKLTLLIYQFVFNRNPEEQTHMKNVKPQIQKELWRIFI